MTVAGYEIGREDGLTKRERQVLEGMREGRTLVEIAGEIGVSKQRVSQIAQALVKKGLLVHGPTGYLLPAGWQR